ncbi:MAG: hypothetical protein KF857_01235 [Fimbriimonadaceae bacterium]|nr:hypothetical protein [Fimbriimonadaceae bacterium]
MILATEAYDPDAPEGSKPRGSDYISGKDLRWIALILVVLAALGYPIYNHMREDSQRTICKRNLSAISKAVIGYAEVYDGRYPPLYVEGDNQTPYLDKGKPIVWASTVSAYMSSYGTFTCPAASKEEATHIHTQTKDGPGEADLTYGMYGPLATRPEQEVARPESTVLVTETANMGARKTFAPVDFQNSKSEVVPFNGFLVGWDNSNFTWDEKTKYVTHLAFYDTADGVFEDDKTPARHGRTIMCLYADGSLGRLVPSNAMVTNDGGGGLSGLWASR